MPVSWDKSLTGEGAAEFLTRVAHQKLKIPAEDVRALTRQRLSDVCSALEQHCQQAIDEFSAAIEELSEDDEAGLHAAQKKYLQQLRAVAILCYEVLAHSQGATPDALHRAAVLLHDNAILSLGNAPEVQDCVVRVCSLWWERKAPGKEALVAQTLPYILLRALTPQAKAADVKLCYSLREAYALLDFDDPTINDLKGLLLRAAMAPAFLTRPEGRKFVGYLFSLQPQFVKELTAIVRNQIPSGRRAVLEAYSEVVFRAWKEAAGGPCAYEVEAELIQGLMHCAIDARTPALAAALRMVLDGLHTQKQDVRLCGALLRLYEPILFRAFAVANPAVRRNALQLLLAAFPILDPEAPAEDTDTLLTRQLVLLKDCLTDKCPAVRCLAVEGVTRALNLYWEIIPPATSAMFITKLTDELAMDVSWPPVRVAVLEGLRLLVDNPHAQPVLKKALPGVACLLADPSLKVREAMAGLLVSLSSSRSLHFYQVVPLPQLLEALAHDVPGVSRRIHLILVPSYCPNPQEGAARVAALLRANAPAGLAFCSHLVSSYLPRGSAEGGAGQEGGEEGGGDEGDDAAAGLGFSATVPIEHILDLASALKDHLLATAQDMVADDTAAAAAAGGEGGSGALSGPAPKRAKTKKAGGVGAAAGKKQAGKRRKQSAPADQDDGDGPGEEGEEEKGATGAVDDAGTSSDVPVEDEPESLATWSATLRGLARLCRGIRHAVEDEACSVGAVESRFESDCLELLLQVVLLKAHSAPEMLECVLAIAGDLHFTSAAASIREELYRQLANGALTGLLPCDAAGGAVRAGADDCMLCCALAALCEGPTAPKLMAALMAALGLREAQPVRKPVAKANGPVGTSGHNHGAPDDLHCHSCGKTHSENTMLLCDGCNSAYHTTCLRPAITDIPGGDWFCPGCEGQLQHGCGLSRDAALACLSVLMSFDKGRTLVYKHCDHAALLTGLQQMATQQVEELVSQETATSSAASSRAKSAAVAATAGYARARSVLGLFCRTTLHLALTSLLDDTDGSGNSDSNDDGDNDEGDDGAQQQQRDAELAAKRQGLCADAISAVLDCLALGKAVADAQQDADAGVRLGHVAAVLAAVCDVHAFSLPLFGGDYVAAVCDTARSALELCVTLAATARQQQQQQQPGGSSSGSAGGPANDELEPLAASATAHVLKLLQQMVAAGTLTQGQQQVQQQQAQETRQAGRPRRKVGAAADADGDAAMHGDDAAEGEEEEEEEGLSQQLEQRLNQVEIGGSGDGAGGAGNDAAADDDEPAPVASMDSLLAGAVQLLVDGDVVVLAQAAAPALEGLAVSWLGSCQPDQHAQWLKHFVAALGSALAGSPHLLQQLASDTASMGTSAAATNKDSHGEGDSEEADDDVSDIQDQGPGQQRHNSRAKRLGQGMQQQQERRRAQVLEALRGTHAALAVLADALLAACSHAQAASWLQAVAASAHMARDTDMALGALCLLDLMGGCTSTTAAPRGAAGKKQAPRHGSKATGAGAVAAGAGAGGQLAALLAALQLNGDVGSGQRDAGAGRPGLEPAGGVVAEAMLGMLKRVTAS